MWAPLTAAEVSVYYYYSNQQHRRKWEKTKLFINCFQYSTSTCALENWKTNSEKQSTTICSFKPTLHFGVKHMEAVSPFTAAEVPVYPIYWCRGARVPPFTAEEVPVYSIYCCRGTRVPPFTAAEVPVYLIYCCRCTRVPPFTAVEVPVFHIYWCRGARVPHLLLSRYPYTTRLIEMVMNYFEM